MSTKAPLLTIARAPVTSSNLKSIGYHPETKQLDVEFSSGSVYRYADVPAEAHAELMKAESIGRHFGQHVRNKFTAVDLASLTDSEGGTPD